MTEYSSSLIFPRTINRLNREWRRCRIIHGICHRSSRRTRVNWQWRQWRIAINNPRANVNYVRLFRRCNKKLYIRRNLYRQDAWYPLLYYITPLHNRRLTLFTNSPRTRESRLARTSRSGELGEISRSGLGSRNGSADFASARIPLVALADMLAARAFTVVVRIGSRAWKANACERMRWERARTDRAAKLYRCQMSTDIQVCAKMIALRFRNFNDPLSARVSLRKFAWNKIHRNNLYFVES